MIKAKAVGPDGRQVLILGLTRENTDRMHRGDPIRVDTARLGLPAMVLMIMAGEGEQDLVRVLGPLIGPDTTVRDEH